MTHPANAFAREFNKLAAPDQTIAITRAVAEELGCPEWIEGPNRCDRKGECYCQNAAERVLRTTTGSIRNAV